LTILAVMVALLAVGIGARLYQLQIVMNERFRIRALDQHQSTVEVPAIRGAILDRHGHPLAVSLERQSLFAHPKRVEQPEHAAELLAPALAMQKSKLLELLRSDKSFVYLKRSLSPEEVAAIGELELPVGANEPFGFEAQHKRYYPNGSLAVHVVGYSNIDGDGLEGIEKTYDKELKGDPALYLVLQDARSNRIRQLIKAPEERPQDVVLTIDHVLQHIVERELDRAIRTTRARAASAVLIDPSTGHILALANRPTADPNRYGKARPAQRINRAVVHYYEPGSTFKFVSMAAALERGKVKRSERIFCEKGHYVTGGRTIRDISPHGYLTPGQILAKSSNIGMVKIVRRLKAMDLRDTIAQFGFASKTGIELPGETPGSLAPVDSWSALTQDSLAFGQEVGVSALQMASAFAAVANDGLLLPPRVVLGTIDADGSFIENSPPAPRRVLSSEAARQLGSMLEEVIAGGTGTKAAVAGYRTAGKSGTAQKAMPGGGYSETDFVASFGGFAPVGAPLIAGLVILDSPHGKRHQGGRVAAPIWGNILEEALHYLRAPAEGNHGLTLVADAAPRTDRRPNRKGPAPLTVGESCAVPDVSGMSLRDAVLTLADHGFGTEVSSGSGYVTAQSPRAGKRLRVGQVCRIRLSERRAG
jgi:cell division protein FtsI/penicillin-binding protein 2